MLTLPAQLTIDDISYGGEEGTAFQNLHEFCKQTIIDACASNDNIRYDAGLQIISALEEKTGKKMTITINEWYSDNNVHNVYLDDHFILFDVKGLLFIFSTRD